MVDNWSTQTVTGVKTFSSTLSASAFWDTTNEVSIIAPAIRTIAGDAAGRVVISNGDGTATCYSTLTYTNNSLTASYYSGSGVGLTSVPPDRFSSALPAASIDYGNGLTASSGQLTVKGGDGITVGSSGVAVSLGTSEGLSIVSTALTVDPTNAVDVTDSGQNLADADVLLVEDISHGLRKTTLTNLYSNYIAGKLPAAAITSYTNSTDNRVLTSVDSTTVNGETNLTFDGSTLTVGANLLTQVAAVPVAQFIHPNDDATGAVLELINSRANNPGQANDFCGGLTFKSKDSTSVATQYSKISTKISSPTNTSEAGRMIFEVTTAGTTATTYLTLDGGASAITASVDTHFLGATHQSSSAYKKHSTKASNYTLTNADNIIYMDTSSTTLTASLPDARTVGGIVYTLKNVGSNNMVIDPNGTQTVDGLNSLTGSLGKAWTVQATGDIWLILSSHQG
jgi:hypothetical protein